MNSDSDEGDGSTENSSFMKASVTREELDQNQTKKQHLEGIQRSNNPVHSLKLHPLHR